MFVWGGGRGGGYLLNLVCGLYVFWNIFRTLFIVVAKKTAKYFRAGVLRSAVDSKSASRISISTKFSFGSLSSFEEVFLLVCVFQEAFFFLETNNIFGTLVTGPLVVLLFFFLFLKKITIIGITEGSYY